MVRPSAGWDADELFRKGRGILAGQPGPASLKQAMLYFERAMELQPEHAESLAALAQTYIHPVIMAMAKGSELLPRAYALAVRAVETDSKLARAHVALGITHLLHERNRAYAEKCFCLAIKLDPGDPLPYRWYAKLLSSRGQHEEAIVAARHALRSDPLSLSVRRDLVETLFAARRYEESIAESHQLIEMIGHSPDIQLGLAWVYFVKGRPKQSIP
jgi:tetratricopeptide (TPR) repeat protein